MGSEDDKWIYESPDGGKTVYRRRPNSLIRECVRELDTPITGTHAEWFDIVELSRTNETLREALEHVIIIYRLTKND